MQGWESDFAWTSFPAQVDWPARGIRSGEGGADALEIVWGIGGSHSVSDLRTVWSARSNNGRRNNPVVAIHLAGEDGPASLVGPGREGVLPPVVVVNDVTRLLAFLIRLSLDQTDSVQESIWSDTFQVWMILLGGFETAVCSPRIRSSIPRNTTMGGGN